MAGQRWWGVAWPGLCATLSGVGFGRFTYTALIPYLISSGQVTAPSAAYLSGATLAAAAPLGAYGVGALGATALAVRSAAATVLRVSFALTSLSFAACAI